MTKFSRFFFFKMLVCIVTAGVSLYVYIFEQNELIALRMAIPSLAKELRSLQEENKSLQYEIDHFESPIHLMELMRLPEFSSLKFGTSAEVILLPHARPLPGKNFSDLQAELNDDEA